MEKKLKPSTPPLKMVIFFLPICCSFWIFCSHKNSWNQSNNWEKHPSLNFKLLYIIRSIASEHFIIFPRFFLFIYLSIIVNSFLFVGFQFFVDFVVHLIHAWKFKSNEIEFSHWMLLVVFETTNTRIHASMHFV